MKREDQDVDVPYGYNEALDKVVANDCKLIIRPRESSLYIYTTPFIKVSNN